MALLVELGVEDPRPWIDGLAAERSPVDRPVGDNPYRGLAPFTGDDVDMFFGREDLVEELVGRVQKQIEAKPEGPVVLVGASGSGKTSVLQAGLVARLLSLGVTSQYLATESGPRLGRAIGPPGSDGSKSPQVLIVDQFETVLGDAQVISVNAVAELARREAAGQVIVIGLRADHYHLGLEHDYLARGLRNPVIPDVMTDDRVADVIELPAQAANMTVEPDLTRQLLVDFGEQVRSGRVGEALPLLSHVLYKIVDAPGETLERTLTVARYREVGGLEGALRNSAEQLYNDLDYEGRATCRQVFANLVEVGRDGLPLRRRAPLAHLLAGSESGSQRSVNEKVMEAFVEQRLLTVEQNTVSISHEALLRAWPRLADWIEEYRDSLSALRRIRSAHESWVANDRDDGSLLAGAELEIANELILEPLFGTQLSEHEQSYIEASDRAASVRARNRQLLFRAAIVTAIVALVLLGVTYTSFTGAQRSRSEAVSRQLSLQSINLAASEPAVSAQLAVAAEAVASTVESRSAVISASGQMPSARYLGQPGATGLALSHDGSRIVYSDSVDGRILVLEKNTTGYHEVAALTLEDPEDDVYGLDISPDGNLVAFGGTDFYANIWDVGTGETSVLDDTLTNYQGAVQSVLFSSNGTEVFASGTSDGGVGRWKVTTGPSQSTAPLIPAAGSVMSIATDEQMTLMATGNDGGEVRLWSLDDPTRPVWSHSAEGSPSALTVAVSPTGDTLAVGYRNGLFDVWSITKPEIPVEIEVNAEAFGSWTTAVAFSPSGNRFIAASSDGKAQLWDTSSWTRIGAPFNHPNGVTNAEFIDDSALVVSLADGSVRTWELDHPHLTSLDAPVWSAAFSPDGKALLATSREQSALWTVDEAGVVKLTAAGIESPESDFQFTGESRLSPDGTTVAAGTSQGAVLLMSLTDDHRFETQQILGSFDSLIESLEYSPDGSLLVSMGVGGELAVWNLEADTDTPTTLKSFGTRLFNVAFKPDGSLLAVTDSDGQLSLFHVGVDGELIERSVTSVATDSTSGVMFHPTEPIIAVGSHDTTVALWNIADSEDPQLIARISSPNGRIHDVGFNGPGNRLGASTSDGTVWIWDVSRSSEPELVARIRSEGQIYTLSFAPVGDLLIGAGVDQRITAWTINQESAAAALCSVLGDPITEDEWLNIVPGVSYEAPC